MNKQEKIVLWSVIGGVFLLVVFYGVLFFDKQNTTITGGVIADYEENEEKTEVIQTKEQEPIVKLEEELVRQPPTYEDAQKFIKPEEARKYLSNFNLNSDNIHDNLDQIMQSMEIQYSYDKGEYWQTPEETLKKEEEIVKIGQ